MYSDSEYLFLGAGFFYKKGKKNKYTHKHKQTNAYKKVNYTVSISFILDSSNKNEIEVKLITDEYLMCVHDEYNDKKYENIQNCVSQNI